MTPRPRPSGGARPSLRVCMVVLSDYHVDSRVQRQAQALAERGDEVHIVCLSRAAELSFGAGRIYLHPVAAGKPRGGARAYLTEYGRFLLGALVRVAALDARGRFDLVEAHNMPDALVLSALVPKLRGTPTILNVHDTFPELFSTKFDRPRNHPLVRLLARQERLSAAFADRVITVTDEARSCLGRRGSGIGKTVVVMNSPDERVFGPRRTPVEVPREGPVRIVYHGGLAPRFGVETLIQAVGLLARELPQAELRVFGTGDEHSRLAQLARQVAPEHIEIMPRPIPFVEIPAAIAAAHIGVVPTMRDAFTELLLPVKLLEYVHMGLPVVASRLATLERYFGPAQLKLVQPGSPHELAAALIDVWRRPSDARRRAALAAAKLTNWSWEAQRGRYLALVDELTLRARHGRRQPRPFPPRSLADSA